METRGIEPVTYEQLTLFKANAEAYLRNAKGRNAFTHALTRVLDWNKGLLDKYNDSVYDIQVDTAIKSKETGSFFPKMDVDPAKAKERNKRLRELLRECIDVNTYIATEIPDDLSDIHYSVFHPFVIAKHPDEFVPPAPESKQ
jgi:hypothetical protein